jgi:hypothetical protein
MTEDRDRSVRSDRTPGLLGTVPCAQRKPSPNSQKLSKSKSESEGGSHERVRGTRMVVAPILCRRREQRSIMRMPERHRLEVKHRSSSSDTLDPHPQYIVAAATRASSPTSRRLSPTSDYPRPPASSKHPVESPAFSTRPNGRLRRGSSSPRRRRPRPRRRRGATDPKEDADRHGQHR